MAYCTQGDYEQRFGATELEQLTDKEGAGAVNAARTAEVMAQASAVIDRYAQAVGTVPIASPGADVRDLALVITRYLLFDRSPPDPVKDQYREAIRYLERVQDGRATLQGLAEAPQGKVATLRGAEDRVFTATKVWDGFLG